ncbi:16S rRNA (uracil(1498)-N(3))-methyltransferase [Arcanobacterium ihumii]|uniref:16S rRNA (uracil(1498)-N(3))-methyltransferase n=1 Tax=Arcanobacterium ihumii TaxID=2138162 RepID=UPI000F545815|nr:16S rRNA (uracil(1498)-N(3))-methyltransferase [Arcanobacterium ihumii]
MTLPVYVDRDLREPKQGDVVTLCGDEARHAVTVRRTTVGEQIDVVDGKGLRVTIEVTATAKTTLSGVVTAVRREDRSKLEITLVQALAKGGRDEQAVETSTEFGVDTVIPWESQRAIVSWSQPAKAEKGRTKWQLTADTAAKQSRRSFVPKIEGVIKSRELSRKIQQWVESGSVVFVCHEQATQTLTTEAKHQGLFGIESGRNDVVDTDACSDRMSTSDGRSDKQSVVCIVGPEGGITDEEISDFRASGAIPVLLGKHVLRSATAGAWAIAVLRALGE